MVFMGDDDIKHPDLTFSRMDFFFVRWDAKMQLDCLNAKKSGCFQRREEEAPLRSAARKTRSQDGNLTRGTPTRKSQPDDDDDGEDDDHH